jgi:hypothetical protein
VARSQIPYPANHIQPTLSLLSSHPYPAHLIQPALSSQPNQSNLTYQTGSIHHDPSSLIHPTLSGQYRIQPTVSNKPYPSYPAHLIQPTLSSQPDQSNLTYQTGSIHHDPSSLIHPTLSGQYRIQPTVSNKPYPSYPAILIQPTLSSQPYPASPINPT